LTRSLIIVQPYVPSYRVPFFEALRADLERHQIVCTVTTGDISNGTAARGDGTSECWMTPVPTKSLKIAGRALELGGTMPAWRHADGVILGSQGSSLDVYRALWWGHTSSSAPKVGLWGHIRDYVNEANPLDRALEKWQLRRADHVFAYTASGGEYARSVGVASGRVTTVMNSVDTSDLENAVAQTSETERLAFADRMNIVDGRALSYIGGLDGSKRIDFLSAALEHLWALAPDVKILIAGRGEHEHLLDAASARGQAIKLGYADAKTKALMAGTSAAMLMPGRIGLVAVDSMVLGLPVLTTPYPFHAPEAEYLTEGVNMITTIDDPMKYAEAMRRIADSSPKFAIAHNSPIPTLSNMVGNYSRGVLTMMNSSRRWPSRAHS